MRELDEIRQLETERLLLRLFTEADVEDVFEYASDPRVVEHLTWPVHKSIERTKKIVTESFINKAGVFAIVLKEEGKCLGAIDLRLDSDNRKVSFGYVLNRNYWNRGYMTEALGEIIRLTFQDLKLNRIEATHYTGNEGSGRVMEKCGMKREGMGKEEVKIKGHFRDVVHYGLVRSDYV